MDEPVPTCLLCGGILAREMGVLSRCAGCRRLYAVSGGYAEPIGSSLCVDLSGSEDWRAEAALRQRERA